MKNSDQPVTVIVTRRPKPGMEKAFEEYITGITQAAIQHEGHLGTNVFRPSGPKEKDYNIIFKFDRRSHLDEWENSEERLQWRNVAKNVSEKPSREIITGLETWFSLPSQPVNLPPPRYKMAVVIWIGIFSLVSVVSALIGNYIADFPLLVRTFSISIIVVPLMTFFVMPFLTRLFSGWLYPGNGKSSK